MNQMLQPCYGKKKVTARLMLVSAHQKGMKIFSLADESIFYSLSPRKKILDLYDSLVPFLIEEDKETSRKITREIVISASANARN